MNASSEWAVIRSAELPSGPALRAAAESLRASGESWTLLSASPPAGRGQRAAATEILLAAGRRAACVHRGRVRWGRWDEARRLVHLDSGPILDVSGRRLRPWRVTDEASHPAWRDYERRLRLLGWAILAFVPGSVATSMLLGPTWGFAAGVWLALVLAAGLRYQAFRCPRCGKRFHQRFPLADPVASSCLHCGLPKWSG